MNNLRAYRAYLLMQGWTSFFMALVFTCTAIYRIQTIHLNPLEMVLVGTTLEGTCFLFEIPTGVVADTFSRRLSVVLGLVFLGAGIGLEGYFPTFGAVLAGQVISGIGYTFLSGAEQAWVAGEVGEEHLGNVFARSGQVGQALGIAGTLASMGLGSINLALPIAVGGGFVLLLAPVLWLLMPETGFKPAPREDRTTWQAMGHTFMEGAKVVSRRPGLVTFLLIEAFFGLASEGWDRLIEAHFLANFAFPALWGLKPIVWLGAMGLAGGFLCIPAIELVRRRVDSQNRGAVVKALSTLSVLKIASVLLCAFAPGFYIAMLGNWGKAVFGSMQYPIYSAWLNQSIDPRVRATVLSMSSQANALGQITGGPGIGAVGNVSVRWAIALSGLLLAPAIPLFARARRQGEESEKGEEALAAQAPPSAETAIVEG